MGRKDKVVDDLAKGIEFLFKKNKIDHIIGAGKIAAADTVEVTLLKGKKEVFKTKNIVVATGSDVAPLSGVKIDEKQIVSSTGALALGKVPKSMIVVGGGVIGLELGSVWCRLGSEVTVVEFLDNILPGMDGDVVEQMFRIMSKQGLKFKLKTKVTSAKVSKTGVSLSVEPHDGGPAESLIADVVLVAIGRRPYSDGLGLDKVGVATDKRGFIVVDHNLQTTVSGVYAIGDVIGGPMLAHKAEEEGVAVAEHIAGQSGHVNYDTIPGIVYTWPEAASLGKTEEDLNEKGIDYKAGKFPFIANSRARANGDSDGFVKILADAKTDKVLGVHIVSPAAGDLIAEAVSVMEFGGSAEDIARTCHAHPCLSEAVKEAALALDGRAIHI
jgi:dihydrolipoamide dehydrogenase